MGSYCKAYPVAKFREYAGWTEPPSGAAADQDNEKYFFIQENLTVTDGIFMDENVVFDRVTPEWEAFCRGQLAFEVPDYCRAGEESTESVEAAQAGGAR
jgi:hypothetical protein